MFFYLFSNSFLSSCVFMFKVSLFFFCIYSVVICVKKIICKTFRRIKWFMKSLLNRVLLKGDKRRIYINFYISHSCLFIKKETKLYKSPSSSSRQCLQTATTTTTAQAHKYYLMINISHSPINYLGLTN